MPRISIDTKFTGPIYNGKYRNIMRQEYRRAVTELVIVGETIVSENTPVGVTGQLRAGVTGKVITHNLGVVIETGPGAKYVDAVEGGRSPGRFPPVDAIMLWVKRKLRVPPGKLKSVAFLVGRKIAKKGIKGKHMFRKAEAKMVGRIKRRIDIASKVIERRLSD